MNFFSNMNFFNKKIKEDIKDIKKRLLRIECPHNVKYLIMKEQWVSYSVDYSQCCSICGKTINHYPDKDHFLVASNKLMELLIQENNREIASVTKSGK